MPKRNCCRSQLQADPQLGKIVAARFTLLQQQRRLLVSCKDIFDRTDEMRSSNVVIGVITNHSFNRTAIDPIKTLENSL